MGLVDRNGLPLNEDIVWASKGFTSKICNGICVLVLQQSITNADFTDFVVVPVGGVTCF